MIFTKFGCVILECTFYFPKKPFFKFQFLTGFQEHEKFIFEIFKNGLKYLFKKKEEKKASWKRRGYILWQHTYLNWIKSERNSNHNKQSGVSSTAKKLEKTVEIIIFLTYSRFRAKWLPSGRFFSKPAEEVLPLRFPIVFSLPFPFLSFRFSFRFVYNNTSLAIKLRELSGNYNIF